MWSSVSDLCKLSSFRYQSEQNRQHPADERLEERRKKIAEERPKKQAYHDLAVQRIYAALALQAQEQGAQAEGEHSRALQSVKAGDDGTPGFRLVGTAQDPVPVMRLGERRAASSRYRTVAPKDAVLAECEGGGRTKPPSATTAAIAAELREGEDAEDAPLTPQEQAALTTDMAELCELGSAPPAMETDGVEMEPEPPVEAPPPSDGEAEEESSEEAEEEEDRPCGSRRARSASSAQPTQSTSRVAKQPRATSSAAGPRGSAPCPRPKRSASRTTSAGAPARKRGGKGKKKK